MPIERLPETVQTLYAELLDQSIRAQAELSPLVPLHGSFVSKAIKGRTYWYLQRLEGDRKRQHYLGPESDSLLAWMADVEAQRKRAAPDAARREQLVEMLVAGGAARETAAVSKVLQVLGGTGMFRLGAVLVGTQAFTCYANVLGVRFEHGSLRTEDVDIAHEPGLGVALVPDQAPADALAALRGVEPTFFAVPSLDPRQPSTSFKVRGRDLRVDFLTPARGRSERPVVLPLFGVAATPLPMIGYLSESPIQAVVLGGGGVLLNVPRPGRFALHKLWLADNRPLSEQTKARKDVRQATQLLEVLLEDRPEEIRAAWDALERRPRDRSIVRKALARAGSGDVLSRARALVGSQR